MKRNITQQKETLIIGIHADTSYYNEAKPTTSSIVTTWKKFFNEKISDNIPNRTNNQHIYACYTNYSNDYKGNYTFVIGHEANTINTVPEGIIALTIQEQTYQVWTAIGTMPNAIIQEWADIWKNYDKHTNETRNYTTDFETHNPNKPEEVDIYIGIHKNNIP